MGLEYYNEVKNSFHLKIIINITKKSLAQVRLNPNPLDERPVIHPHNQPTSS